MLKKIFALVICLCAIVSSYFAVLAEEDSMSASLAKDGYEAVAQNNNFKLYANLKTGDFAILETEKNSLWYSGQRDVLDKEHVASEENTGRIKTDLVSMIAVNYVQVSTIASTAVPAYQNSYAYCVIKSGIKTKKITGGYRCDYYFEDIESTVPVEITLTDSGFTATIVGKDIKMGEEYHITSIELLPGFMASDYRNEGYMFVPSGSGGIIPLNSGRGDLAAYDEMVYGDDAGIENEEYESEKRNISVPVYGIKCGDTAITAIISKGDSSAKICAEANSSTTSFSRIFSEYVTAIVDSTTLFESNYENHRIIYGIEMRKGFDDYSVNYSFLSGEDATYSGMAKTYRDYCLEKGLAKSADTPKLYITLYGAATKKASFLGIPYTKTISLTSFSEAKDIVKDLSKGDIDVALRYLGWNNSGIENKKIPTKFSPVSVLGGKSDFNELYNYLEKSDDKAYFELDFLSIRKSGRGFSKMSDVIKSIFSTRTPQYKYMRSVLVPVNNENPSYLLTSNNVKEAAKKFADSYKKYSGGVSLSGVGSMLYSDFSKHGHSREDTINNFRETVKAMGDREIALSNPNAYIFDLVDTIYDIPLTNDGNLLFSESVPFLQMVLHGHISYGAESGATLLECIEYGASPSFAGIKSDDSLLIETTFNWLYGSSYKNWSKQAKEDFTTYQKVYKSLYDKEIILHKSENSISFTKFEDGTLIIVNKTNKQVTIDENIVEANNFKVIGG